MSKQFQKSNVTPAPPCTSLGGMACALSGPAPLPRSPQRAEPLPGRSRAGLSLLLPALLLGAFSLFAGATAGAQEQAPVTENADGTVTVVLEDLQFLIPAVVAEEVIAAVRDLADDSQALEEALYSIVVRHAGGSDDAEQAAAIAAFAVSRAGGRAASVDAIVRGALDGNGDIPAAALLAAIAEAGLDPRARTDAEQRLAELQATLEDPRRVSPVE